MACRKRRPAGRANNAGLTAAMRRPGNYCKRRRSSRAICSLASPPTTYSAWPMPAAIPKRRAPCTQESRGRRRDAITRTITNLPEQLRQSLTWDQGAEMSQHVQLRIDTGLQIYFCDPQSPWQRGTNENTNGLLRQYFPKGTDLSLHTPDELNAVAHAINTKPRKTLSWKTPAESLHHFLRSYIQKGVATTG